MTAGIAVPALIQSALRARDNAPWPRSLREAVIQWLRIVLTNRTAFQVHLRSLRGGHSQLGHVADTLLLDFANYQTLPDEIVYKIEQTGFEGVSDEVLRRLLVNPVALQDLARLVEDAPEGYWADVVAETRPEQPPRSILDELRDSPVSLDDVSHDPVLTALRDEQTRIGEVHYTCVQLRRRELEPEGIDGLSVLPLEQYEAVVEELGASAERLPALEGLEFLREDVHFHLLLARHAPVETHRTLRQLIRLIVEYGGASIVTPEARNAVYREHQRIVESLRQRNPAAARQYLGEHLHEARERWCPGSAVRIRTANARFFDTMLHGDALFFCALELTPVEFEDEFLMARMAEAVRRAAYFIYFRPGKRLLKEYRTAGLPIEDLQTSRELRRAFSRVRRRVAELVAGVTAGQNVPDEVRDTVRKHLVQFELHREIPFLQAGRAVGYFLRSEQQVGTFTERNLITERDTWPEIASAPTDPGLLGRHFKFTIARVLHELARKKTPGDQRRQARRLYSKWFAPPQSPSCPVKKP